MPVLCPYKEFEATSSVRDVEREFHPIGLPLLRLTYCKTFRVGDSSVAPTTVCLFTETLEESRSRRQIREEGEKENKSEERVENDTP